MNKKKRRARKQSALVNTAAVSCSANGNRLGGVRLVSGMTSKLGSAWVYEWVGEWVPGGW